MDIEKMDLINASKTMGEFMAKEGPIQFGTDAATFIRLLKAPHEIKDIAALFRNGSAVVDLEALQRAVPILLGIAKDKDKAKSLADLIESLG